MTIHFLRFFKILRKFFLSLATIISANNIPHGTLLLAGTIRVNADMLILSLVCVRDQFPVTCGQLCEKLLDFSGERHFFWYSDCEKPGIYGLFTPWSNDTSFLAFFKKVLRNPFYF